MGIDDPVAARPAVEPGLRPMEGKPPVLARFTALTDRLRQSALVIPAAVLVAVLMLVINEVAYHGAQSRLGRLVEMGRARMLLLQTLQLTSEAESGERGYMMTGGKEYLLPYLEARDQVLANLHRLEQAYTRLGDGDAMRRRPRLNELVNAKLAEMDEVKRLFDSGRLEQALDLVRSGIGRELMAELRDESNSLVTHQNDRIGTGLSEFVDTLLLNRIGIIVITLLGLLMLMKFARLSRQLDRQRLERLSEVAAERDRLEVEVAHRTADLTELACHLQTAREDERAHLARELHDELGALLTSAKLEVARIKPKLQQAVPDLLPRVTHLTESLNSCIALKRRIIEDLRPSTLDSLGLHAALEILCADFKDRSGVEVRASLQPVALSPTAELTVFRLVQEALTNVAKHAGAKEVRVQLHAVDGMAEVRVVDDGRGFDSATLRGGSHGLIGMRFRVEAGRGQFELKSALGAGTMLLARIPMEHDRRCQPIQ